MVVLSMGASNEVANALPAETLGEVLKAYAVAVQRTFILTIPIAGIAFFVSLFHPWFRYHKPDEAGGKAATVTGEEEAGEKVAE
jgi:hypothetical protein